MKLHLQLIKEILQNKVVSGILNTVAGVEQIVVGVGMCSTVAGTLGGIPVIINGANMALTGIQDLWHAVRGEWDAESVDLIKELTGHKFDNTVDLTEFAITMGTAKDVSKLNQQAMSKAKSQLKSALNKARKFGSTVSNEMRAMRNSARALCRKEVAKLCGPRLAPAGVPVNARMLAEEFSAEKRFVRKSAKAKNSRLLSETKQNLKPHHMGDAELNGALESSSNPKRKTSKGSTDATRKQAFRDAKETAGIPKSAEYKTHKFVYDGTSENRIVYEFDVSGEKKYIIEHPFDKMGRGNHFHGADATKGSPFSKGRYNQYPGHFPEDFNGFK